MPPLIAPDYWMNSQLSIARHYGGCIIEHHYYFICKENNYLVRSDFRIPLVKLGFKTVEKAVKRYDDADKAQKIVFRLAKIIKARKRTEKTKDTKEETLF